MPKQLTTQNATITTVTVEVKALTIGGKQVTLSVFRQLQDEQLIADDGTLNGVPWGFVNYHPDKCSDFPDHWHIVWQHGAELRRSRIAQEPHWSAMSPPEADQLLNSMILSWATDPDSPIKRCPLVQTNSDSTYPRFAKVRRWTHPPTGINFADEPSPAAVKVATTATAAKHYRRSAAETPSLSHQRQFADQAEAAKDYQTALAQLRDEVDGYGRTLDELMEDVSILAIAEAQRQQRHRLVRAGLAQLPQLFIAV